MDTRAITHFRNAITEIFRRWERLPSPISTFRIVGLLDTGQDRYTLQHIEHEGNLPIARTLAYLEIREGKIWIEIDNTEKGIAAELVEAGIPKSQIVLAFYPPALREMSDFATA